MAFKDIKIVLLFFYKKLLPRHLFIDIVKKVPLMSATSQISVISHFVFQFLLIYFQFSQFSQVRLFVTPWTVACQASLTITNSWSLLKFMSTELVMPSNHLILCSRLLLLPSIFPSIRVFSKWVNSSHQVAKVLELRHQHQSLLLLFFSHQEVSDFLWPYGL